MNPPLFNSLEVNGDTFAVHASRAKMRLTLWNNVFSAAALIAADAFAWLIRSPLLMAFNIVLGILALPVALMVIWLSIRGLRRAAPSIELDGTELRFFLNCSHPIVMRRNDFAQLELIPSPHGQTLLVMSADEKALRARLSLGTRLYLVFSRIYCGHPMGLTPNLSPEDYRRFSQALERTFPNRVATRQKAHRPPLIPRLLGVKTYEAPLAVHVPPPLSKA